MGPIEDDHTEDLQLASRSLALTEEIPDDANPEEMLRLLNGKRALLLEQQLKGVRQEEIFCYLNDVDTRVLAILLREPELFLEILDQWHVLEEFEPSQTERSFGELYYALNNMSIDDVIYNQECNRQERSPERALDKRADWERLDRTDERLNAVSLEIKLRDKIAEARARYFLFGHFRGETGRDQMRRALLFIFAEIYQKNDSEIPPQISAILNEQERLLLSRKKGEMKDSDGILTLLGGSNRDILEKLLQIDGALSAERAKTWVDHKSQFVIPQIIKDEQEAKTRWQEKEKPFLDSLLADFPDPLELADILLGLKH